MITRKQPGAGAVFSECERYRYLLWREIKSDHGATVVWCMLNPSTATELALDPTLTRVDSFSKKFGYSRWEVVNVFALRSTDPKGLKAVSDPIGEHNDEAIKKAFWGASCIFVGWGSYPLVASRASRIIELAGGKPLYCLGVNKNGSPKHPLYLRADSTITSWPTLNE